jgi:hypothetical protein
MRAMKQKHWDDLYFMLITEDAADRAEAIAKYGIAAVEQSEQTIVVKAAIMYRRRKGMNAT